MSVLAGVIAVGAVVFGTGAWMAARGMFKSGGDYDFGPSIAGFAFICIAAASAAVLLVYWAVVWLTAHDARRFETRRDAQLIATAIRKRGTSCSVVLAPQEDSDYERQ